MRCLAAIKYPRNIKSTQPLVSVVIDKQYTTYLLPSNFRLSTDAWVNTATYWSALITTFADSTCSLCYETLAMLQRHLEILDPLHISLWNAELQF